MVFFPGVEERRESLGAKLGLGGFREPRREGLARGFRGGADIVAERGIEGNAELIDFHDGIIPWWEILRYDDQYRGRRHFPRPTYGNPMLLLRITLGS